MTLRSSCGTCCMVYAKCLLVGLCLIVIVCTIGAIIGPAKFNKMVDEKISTTIDEMMVLTPSTELYQNWIDPQIPVYQKFYFFDVQNADDVLNAGAKPRLVEVGPYTYRYETLRYNVTFDDGDRLAYEQINWLEFAPELSAGFENDSVTIVNVPFAALLSGVKFENWFSRMSIAALASIHGHEMFTKLTIGELLWGYEDPLLKQLQEMTGKEKVPTYEVGLLHGKNGSVSNGVINTGASDSSMVNQIIEYKGKTAVEWWKTPEANMINGSDGSILHPGMTAEETIYVYNPLRYRTVPFIYQDSLVHYDTSLMRFHIPWYTYANASRYPTNDAFCLQDQCPDGILNVTECAKLPLGMSSPHFLYASPDIVESFDGIEPNETEHQSYIDVEPITGVSFKQRRRLQFNVYMEPVDYIAQTEGIRSMYYPLCWIEVSMDLPESIARDIQNEMSAADGFDDVIFYGSIGIAALCIVLIICILLCVATKCCKKKAIKSDSNGGPYVAVNKDSDSITSKPYSNGIPKNIYLQIPNDDDNDNNNTTDDGSNEKRCDITTESAVEINVSKLNVSKANTLTESVIETEV